MKDRDRSKQEADHHAKMLPSTAWLMTILQAKNTTVGIVATCSCRGPDLEPSITAEIAYYTHGSLITQNCQWKYLLRPTTSKSAITHHHQLLLLEITWPLEYSAYVFKSEALTYSIHLVTEGACDAGALCMCLSNLSTHALSHEVWQQHDEDVDSSKTVSGSLLRAHGKADEPSRALICDNCARHTGVQLFSYFP